jgi:hypothetical protein
MNLGKKNLPDYSRIHGLKWIESAWSVADGGLIKLRIHRIHTIIDAQPHSTGISYCPAACRRQSLWQIGQYL